MRPNLGDRVPTAHGPGRVTQVHARIQEPSGGLAWLVTAELDEPYRIDGPSLGGLEWVRRLETVVPIVEQA